MTKPTGVEARARSVDVHGKRIAGLVVPPGPKGRRVKVDVIMDAI